MLGKVVLRYLEGMDEPLINSIQAILRATMGGMSVASAEGIATLQSLCQEVGCPYHDELGSTTCCVALVVLWMGLHQEKFPLLATSLQAAAGVVGRQRWALILPSSARVSLVTYTAVIAVRYPELDNVQNDLVCFGNYLLGEQATSGGFLPIFWDAPSAYMHAATDIGTAVDWLQRQVTLSSDENGCRAVLHNRNKMVVPGGMETLYSLANVPKSWPLARLTIPLSAASKHLERLLEGHCMEVLVTNSNPDSQLHFVRKFAKDLVVVFAFHLAETISALFRHVLDHPSKVLYDPETEPLFLPLFWFYPIYREMLNSASRHRPSKSMELRRAASGLVKVICRTEESRPGGKGLKPGKPKKKGLLASFGDWFGSINTMNILYVWFPASWGPSVVEAIQKRIGLP